MIDGRVLLIANPAAQRGNGAQAAQIAYDLLTEWLGSDNVDFALTERPGHATLLASQCNKSRYRVVIALGGDGIVHEVVNGLMQLPQNERPTFGLIPVGSGNDYAKTLGMSTCVPDAIVQFLTAHEKPFDIGKCNSTYYAETLSFGIDAAIALDTIERRKKTGKQGTILYLSSGIDQLMHHMDIYTMHLVIDQERSIDCDVYQLAVQIGPTYGGGFKVCPKANPQDGFLHLCYAQAPMLKFVGIFKFLSAKGGLHTAMKGINFTEAKSLELTFNRRPPCQIDGEPLIANSYSISLVPAALNVLVSSDSAFYD